MPLRSLLLVTAFALAVGASLADEVLYTYEGDVLPYDESAGWLIADPCEYPCGESVADGHFVLNWPEPGNFANYHYWIAQPPEATPPTLWVEWRFRSNHPLGPYFYGCDGRFSVNYGGMHDGVYMDGDAVVHFSGNFGVTGLDMEEFHTYRYESLDGVNYRFAVDGLIFVVLTQDQPPGVHYMQFSGDGGCAGDWVPNQTNEWDFVRYGEIAFGEQIASTDPPQGNLDPDVHTDLDRFTITFDAPNFAYIDDITVEVTGGVAPVVTQVWRRDNHGPDTVQIVLDRPIPDDEITTFTLDDGTVVNTVQYSLERDSDNDGVPDKRDIDPLDPDICEDADNDGCDDCAIGTDDEGPLPDNDPANDGPDADADGICDIGDNCLFDPNPGQEDDDGDAVGDACDGCPQDVNKTEPGICGCGAPDIDTDGDGTYDCHDLCPTDPEKTDPGQCGCHQSENDDDDDGVADCNDLCPGIDDTVFAPGCVGPIPTVSAWGVLILALLLLTAGKVYFGHRRAMGRAA